jgi:prepilin-type N-terminal cleavage/methylation domain-containing protein
MTGYFMKKSNQKGFTLIELLVVIAIIGLLSTLAVVALNSARAKSRDAKRIADVKEIQTALELYYADNNAYPVAAGITLGIPAESGLSSSGFCGTGGTACSGTTYMGLVPAAPTAADGTCASGFSSTAYVYTAPAGGASYGIAYCLGSATGDVAAGGHTATQNGIQ